jgi:hypothetical protein
MRRFLLLLNNEVKLVRTTLPIHLIALFQPALMFSLMAFVLITPTFDVYVARTADPAQDALIAMMEQVGSPIGDAYIRPIEVEWVHGDPIPRGQVIWVDSSSGKPTATQIFGLVDSNMVKNFRNRLTSAALLLWQKNLGSSAIEIDQIPQLPHDVSYRVYYGLAMLPLAAFIGAGFVAAFLTAQEFEFKTITEYQLSPAPWVLVLITRLLRLCLTGLLSGIILALFLYFFDRALPSSPLLAILALLAMGLIGAGVGTALALMLRSTLPAFVTTLAGGFFTWIMGGAFGLPAGFGGAYETVSHWMPNTYAVSTLYSLYYRTREFDPLHALSSLLLFAGVGCLIVMLIYRKVVVRTGESGR